VARGRTKGKHGRGPAKFVGRSLPTAAIVELWLAEPIVLGGNPKEGLACWRLQLLVC
jgi:hypothetical protein